MASLKEKMSLKEKLQAEEKAEPKEKNRTIVSNIAGTNNKNKLISAKVNEEVYSKFKKINKARGMSNNSTLNMLISAYVDENKHLID